MRQLLFIPCKPFAIAKSRLASVLTQSKREGLVRALCWNTLFQVSSSGAKLEPIVISRDPEVLSIARKLGFGFICETGAAYDLNESLQQATSLFSIEKGLRFGYLPIDLPRLNRSVVASLVGTGDDDWIIAPDQQEYGTNALSWPAKSTFRLAFGPASYSAHRDQMPLGSLVRTVRLDCLRQDLDYPQDLFVASHVLTHERAANELIENLTRFD